MIQCAPEKNMHFWCMNFGGGHHSHAPHHVMLGGEDDDAAANKERYETEERRLRHEEEGPDEMRNTSFNDSGALAPPTSAGSGGGSNSGGGGGGGNYMSHHHDSETGGDLRVLTSRDDGRDFRIGNTVLSPYCCVGLIIFALLFILIGSVLTYAITRHSDAEVLRFLNKHNYLKAVSPLMICSGIIMLLLGIAFWVVRRCRSRRRPSSTATASESYFPPEGLAPQRCLPDTLLRGAGRNSMGSAISSRAVSPLLPPASAGGRADNVEWKWPSQQSAAAPPLGSFPRHSSNDSSPVHSVKDVEERVQELQPSSIDATPCDYSIPDVKVIPVSSSSTTTTTTTTTTNNPLDIS